MVLVPESSTGLAGRLEELGLEPREEFVCLMARTTRVARIPQMVPQAIPNGAVIT
jgi:hypothetical protein